LSSTHRPCNQSPAPHTHTHTHTHIDREREREITSVGKDIEKRKPLYAVGRNVNPCSHYEKQYKVSSKKLENKVLQDLLGVYPKEMNM
jgi:hypothetical protein